MRREIVIYAFIVAIISISINFIFQLLNELQLNHNIQQLKYAINNNQDVTPFLNDLDDFGFTLNLLFASTLIISVTFILYKIVNRTILKIENIQSDVLLIEGGNSNHSIGLSGILELDKLSNSINKMNSSYNELLQEKERIFTNISHDMKTPLTTIKGYLYIIKEGHYKDQTELENYLEKMLVKVDDINSLINRVIQLKIHDQHTFLPVTDFCTIFEAHIESLNFKEFHYENQINPESTLWIPLDKSTVSRFITNNIGNLIKYASTDELVSIEVNIIDKKLNIVFSNITTTKTINRINKLKERFFTLDDSRSESSTGLGLSIIDEIIKKCDGEFNIYNCKNRIFFSYVIPLQKSNTI